MTFDFAQDAFRLKQNARTAATYLRIALEYWLDGMIGAGTLAATLKEVKEWLEEEADDQ